jgi:hypothetical protein
MGGGSVESRGGNRTFIIRNGPVESIMKLSYSRKYFTHRKTASAFGLNTNGSPATQDGGWVHVERPNHEYEP